MDKAGESNLKVWDSWVEGHAGSALYDVEGFKAGRCSLKANEIAEVGDVAGMRLLHLQCHFGMDTLSWARRGARVTGADFSPKAISLATSLAAELDIPAEFGVMNAKSQCPSNRAVLPDGQKRGFSSLLHMSQCPSNRAVLPDAQMSLDHIIPHSQSQCPSNRAVLPDPGLPIPCAARGLHPVCDSGHYGRRFRHLLGMDAGFLSP